MIFRWRASLTALVFVAGCQASDKRSNDGAPLAPVPALAEAHADDKTVLAVPQIQQEALLCVPTSAAMVLTYYGDPQPPRRLKVLAAGGVYNPSAPFSDFSITLYRDIVRAVQSLGYSWMERSYPDTDAGFTDGLALIKSQVRNGHPVLVDISAPDGHTFVVAGFNVTDRTLFAVDPNRPAPGRRWISYDDFKAIWNEHAFGGQFRSLVTTQNRDGA